MDLRTRRIPNLLTVSAVVVGFTLNIWCWGRAGAISSSVGLLFGLAAFLPFYLAGGFGAGDVKAMAAIGAFVGPKGALLAAGCTLLVGALVGLALFAAFALQPQHAGNGTTRLRNLIARRFPYGLAIAVGTACSFAWS